MCRGRKLKGEFYTKLLLVILLIYTIYYNIENMKEIVYIKNARTVMVFNIHTDKVTDNYKSVSNKSLAQVIKTDDVMKYILLWTNPNHTPFNYFGTGQTVFKEKKCRWSNCYVTVDRNYLGDYSEFEVIAFNGPDLTAINYISTFPLRRNSKQKYVYANIESADNYPVCTDIWDEFFNWTWTYKLNSDALWNYIVVRDCNGTIIGPSLNTHWLSVHEMEPIDDQLKYILSNKTKAVAWFVSNCKTKSLREELAREIGRHLKQYDLYVDIYGECGSMSCPRNDMEHCLYILERDYFFYFAFENALSDDYVTEKILYALNHNTVPIVYGGANYSKFMPNSIYLNALELGPEKLARKMYYIIRDSSFYYQFFRWKKHYTFHSKGETIDTDDYCTFCSMMNDETIMKETTIYRNFKNWWTPNGTCNKK